MRQPCQLPPPGSPPCSCAVNSPGCGHYGCFGAAPRTCPGVAAEEARYAAVLAAKRAEDARTLSRRARLGATYRAMVLSTFAVRRINP
jgi:hypothetical protein